MGRRHGIGTEVVYWSIGSRWRGRLRFVFQGSLAEWYRYTIAKPAVVLAAAGERHGWISRVALSAELLRNSVGALGRWLVWRDKAFDEFWP